MFEVKEFNLLSEHVLRGREFVIFVGRKFHALADETENKLALLESLIQRTLSALVLRVEY